MAKVKIKNVSDGLNGFRDDDRKTHILKPGETVECNYRRIDVLDPKFAVVTEKKEKEKKKKEVN